MCRKNEKYTIFFFDSIIIFVSLKLKNYIFFVSKNTNHKKHESIIERKKFKTHILAHYMKLMKKYCQNTSLEINEIFILNKFNQRNSCYAFFFIHL